MFHSKEVTFSGRSLHWGWHRKVVLVSRCFSGKVKLASHASRNYKHGEDGQINDIIKRLLVRQKNLCRFIRKRLILDAATSKPEETLPAPSRTRTLALPSQLDSPSSLIGVAMQKSALWLADLSQWVIIPPSKTHTHTHAKRNKGKTYWRCLQRLSCKLMSKLRLINA